MMAEKEGGVIEGANFNSLWEVSTSIDGTKRLVKALSGTGNCFWRG